MQDLEKIKKLSSNIILVAGISNSGKSTFANEFCKSVPNSIHLPLDKYFKDVPQGLAFLEWILYSKSIDWELVKNHIQILNKYHYCYTPYYDWRESLKRIWEGGLDFHKNSLLMKGKPTFIIIPGCLSFEFPGKSILNIYIDTSITKIKKRSNTNNIIQDKEKNRLFINKADVIVNGELPFENQIKKIKI